MMSRYKHLLVVSVVSQLKASLNETCGTCVLFILVLCFCGLVLEITHYIFSLQDLHKCGCADGLVCKETASVTLPITGTKLSLKQCMDA